MARGYKTTPGQYLDFVYKVPQDLLIGVIENLDNRIAKTEAGALSLSEKLVGDAIQEDMPRFKELVTGYQSEIDEIVKGIYDSPLSYKKYRPTVENLSRKIQRDWTTGEVAAIQSRKKMYDAYAKEYREAYKENPLLANYAVKNIGIDPLNYDPASGTYGNIKGANMVKHIDAKDMTDMVNKIVDNIKDTDLARYGLSRQDLTEWESAWTSGKVEGRKFEEITSIVLSQIPSDVFMSAQQWSNAVAAASGSEPTNEFNVWEEDEQGNRRLNTNTQIGRIVAGAAAGRAREEYKMLQSLKTKDFDAVAATNMKYKKKYAKWEAESPGIYVKFGAGESAVIPPTYEETVGLLKDNRSALIAAKEQLAALKPTDPGYAANKASLESTIASLENEINNNTSALDRYDKDLQASPYNTFDWDGEYAKYQEALAKWGKDLGIEMPKTKEEFRELVLTGLPEQDKSVSNNAFMRWLSDFGVKAAPGSRGAITITRDGGAGEELNNILGVINSAHKRYRKASKKFVDTQSIQYATGYNAYLTAEGEGAYKSIVGGAEDVLTGAVSTHFSDYMTLDGRPLAQIDPKKNTLTESSVFKTYATRDRSKDKVSFGFEYMPGTGTPIYLLSMYDEDGKLLGREKVVPTKNIGNEAQTVERVGRKLWQNHENGSKEWDDGIGLAAIGTVVPIIEKSGIGSQDEAYTKIGRVDIAIKKNPVTGNLTATLTDPTGGTTEVTAGDNLALAKEIYKVMNGAEIEAYSKQIAPPQVQGTSQGESEFIYETGQDED